MPADANEPFTASTGQCRPAKLQIDRLRGHHAASTRCFAPYPGIWELPGAFVSDGNAASSETKFFDGAGDLEQLDWDCLDDELYWQKKSDEYKRIRMAEVLVPECVAIDHIKKIVVRNESDKHRIASGLPWPVYVCPGWFYQEKEGSPYA